MGDQSPTVKATFERIEKFRCLCAPATCRECGEQWSGIEHMPVWQRPVVCPACNAPFAVPLNAKESSNA